jgi:hypothetical protein
MRAGRGGSPAADEVEFIANRGRHVLDNSLLSRCYPAVLFAGRTRKAVRVQKLTISWVGPKEILMEDCRITGPVLGELPDAEPQLGLEVFNLCAKST